MKPNRKKKNWFPIKWCVRRSCRWKMMKKDRLMIMCLSKIEQGKWYELKGGMDMMSLLHTLSIVAR